MVTPSEPYAARLEIDYPEQLDRFTTFFRLIWIIPIFIIMKNIGLINTRLGLVMVYLISTFPYSYMMLRSYIGSISQSLEEAALEHYECLEE